MIEIIDDSGEQEFVDPYYLYETARGGGCSHEQAVREVRDYCQSVGLDPHSI